ncbi:phospholipase D-like domain-containing protein [Piscirickettsia salmonis]|uniref:phospholipase D-like domain-containing protein n=1 Tax=Piscirickettsia salmonis TaxID=1238 RepID=UPI0007C95A28|nr:Phospholipase D precursor [Piscirickettsiaceae bacterium NZ-RLO1]
MKIKSLLIASNFIFCLQLIHASPLKEIYHDIINQTDIEKKQEGVTYSLTENNLLNDDFLIQFPGKEIWGKRVTDYPGFEFNPSLDLDFGLPHCHTQSQCMTNSSCSHLATFDNSENKKHIKMCNGYADQKLDRIYNVIVHAEHFVDITTLESWPDLKFRSTLRNALTVLAKTGKKITVRMLAGVYQPFPSKQSSNEQIQRKFFANNYVTWYFLDDLIRDIKNIPESNLDIYVAGMRSCSGTCDPDVQMSLSWNHSKIINIDGKKIISGGLNMYSTDYLMKNPVFDLMIEIQGPVANKALGFTNLLWDFVKNNIYSFLNVIEYSARKENQYRIVKSDLPKHHLHAKDSPSGSVEILSIGRTGYGLYTEDSAKNNNNSDYALYDLLSRAKKSIYLAQQSLKANFNIWPYDTTDQAHTNFISALAKLIVNKGNVYIVTSPYNDGSLLELGYLSSASPEELWNKIKNETIAMYPNLTENRINKKLCNKLHISEIRFNNHDTVWGDGSKITDHYKFMMVDRQMFYVGSQNFYPSGLQNYGHIINDTKAARIVRRDFWKPLWKYSAKTEYKPEQCTLLAE